MTDKQTRLLRNLVLVAAAGLSAGWLLGRCSADGGGKPSAESSDTLSVRRDTVTIRDTVAVPYPVPAETRVVRDTVVAAPLASDTAESAEVALPVVERHYGDSLYEAWVSGPVDPRLDSLRVYPRTMVVTERVTIRDPPPRWGLSVGLGVTATPRGIEPGVFVGVTYTFAAFGGRNRQSK